MKKTIYRLMSVIVSLTLVMGWYANAGARAVKAVYVNPNGSDSNSGSASAPFKTLSKGMSVLVAGDTLYVSGTFNVPLYASKSGTATAPITIIGNGAVLNVKYSQDVGMSITGSYVNVSGFDVMGAVSHGVLISGKHIRFENSLVHNNIAGSAGTGTCSSTVSWGSGLKIMVGADDVVLKGNQVYENCGEGIGITRGLNVVADGNTVRDNFSVNVYVDNSPYAVVQNNYVSCTGIYLRDGVRATGIALAEEIYSGWGAQRHDDKVLNNTVNGCYDGIASWKPQVTGGKLINSSISGNVVTSGVRRSVAIYSENQNAVVDSNKVYAAVYVSNSTGLTLSNNQVTGTVSITPTVTTAVPTSTQIATTVPTSTPTTLPTGQNIVDIHIASGADDIEESASGWMYIDSSDLELVFDANTQKIGLRFNGVGIPQNATILNAYVQFTADVATTNATTLVVQGEKSPNATAFTTKTGNLSSRVKTTASVNWTPASWLTAGAKGTDQRTPNLAPVIQEVINQTGWTSGNSIAIIVTGNGKRAAKSYEGNASGAPVLHIEYSTGSTLLAQLPQTETPIPASTPVVATSTPMPEITAQPAPELTFDDTDANFTYSPDWFSLDAQDANGGSYKVTTVAGASVSLNFTGQSFSVLYTDGQEYKGMEVYVDGVLVGTVLRQADGITYQQRWDYPGLLDYGPHTIQLVFPNGNGSLDAVIVR